MEKKRVGAKRRMVHAALDSGFLYEALFSEQTPMPRLTCPLGLFRGSMTSLWITRRSSAPWLQRAMR
jgi:hypothetical protein